MKATIKSLTQLTTELRSLIDQGFSFELTQKEINLSVNKWFDSQMFTDSGNWRYPTYYSKALRAFYFEFINVRMAENTLFCYCVDGVLYTTYKKSASYYKGDVTLKNYKDCPIIEEKVLYSKGNITNGYYYNSGKPYFVKLESQE